MINNKNTKINTFDFDPVKHHDELLFIPLGGSNEIGMNLNLYHYKGKWLLVDLGIGFCEQDLPGVDITLPKIDFIEQYKEDIVGLVLTHAHEDHIGGVPYLWQYLECPIYTTKFTASVLKAKFAEFNIPTEVEIPIIEVAGNGIIDLEPFLFEMVGITHSIPEMHGLVIRTEKGNIFHTGDWKLDPNPIVGARTNETRLKELGEEGILAMVCDSTNVFTEGHSRSEGELSESIAELIQKERDGLVIITTFASNIARLHSIATAAKNSGRKVALAGRALWRMYNAARDSGYLTDLEQFLQPSEVKHYKRNEVLIICTGCQGEVLAATNKMASGQHPDIQLQQGDTIIFSSKIIPGNEKRISNLLNQFCRAGIEVMTERDHFVHVSGHPAREELARMYELIRPQLAIPVHGEAVHLHEHCKFANKCGVPKSIEVTNGAVVHLSGNTPSIIANVESGYLGVDGNDIIDESNLIFRERRDMRDNGTIVVLALLNNNKKLIKRPKILAIGLLDKDDQEDLALIDTLSDEVKKIIINTIERTERSKINKTIGRMIEKICKRERGKSPRIVVHFEYLGPKN